MRLNDLLSRLDLAVLRLQFYGAVRVELYEALSLLLENRVLLETALKDMHKIFSENGKKPKRVLAAVTYDCYREVADGKPLSKALAKWIPYQEYTLISAGEKSSDLKTAFDNCRKIIVAKQEIVGAILLATLYPAFLMGMICVLLSMVSTKLVPKLIRTSNPDTWTGTASLLYEMSKFVISYGSLTLIMLLLSIVAIFASLPYLKGNIRVYLDKVPPWSVYRMLHGSTFLLNVGVMIQANVSIQDALRMMASQANPWLKQRLDAAFYGLGIGGNLGVALSKAGYDFPDKKAVQFLMILSSKDGFDEALNNFGERWLRKSIQQIQFAAKLSMGTGIILVGVILMTVISGVSGIQDAIQAAAK